MSEPKFLKAEELGKLVRAHARRPREPLGRLLLTPFLQAASDDGGTMRALFYVANARLVDLVEELPADPNPPEMGEHDHRALTPTQWMRLQLAHCHHDQQRFGQLVVNVAETRWQRGAMRRLFAVSNHELVELVEAFAVGVLRPERPDAVVVPGAALTDRMRALTRRAEPRCHCGHAQHEHSIRSGLCIIAGCVCSSFIEMVERRAGGT